MKDELKRLQQKRDRIKCVLHDAERKCIQSEVIACSMLMKSSTSAELRVESCRMTSRMFHQMHLSVGCNFPSFLSRFTGVHFCHEIGDKIKNLNQRLDEMSKDMSAK